MCDSRKIDLTPSELQIVQQILAEHIPDRPVFVFGSRATGRARRRSDLDLAVGGDTPLGRRITANLREAFDQSDLPIEVDVVDLTDATGIFRTRIENEWIPLEVAVEQLTLQATG
jgi:predicted nucleotidyltransferase